MDWDASIERNRMVLVGIVSSLAAMLGLAGSMPETVRTRVLRILRPAESAVRRLVFVMARRMGAVSTTPNAQGHRLVRRAA
jgi:hypothetical protein